MSQALIIKIFKENPQKFFSANELKEITGKNIQTVYSALKRLTKSKEVKVNTFAHKQGPALKMYSYLEDDDEMCSILMEYNRLKNEHTFATPGFLTNLMVVKELKRLVRGMKNES